MTIPRTLTLIALCATLLGACSATDAPTAGKEIFAPISNDAYHIRTGPMVDRGFIQRRPVE